MGMLEKRARKGIDIEIRKIDQEIAGAEKRLERFKQARADIQSRNRANLETMGIASARDLEKAMKAQGVHPQGMEMFKAALAEKGKAIPDFLEGLVASKKVGEPGKALDPGALPQETVKKKKRVRIRL